MNFGTGQQYDQQGGFTLPMLALFIVVLFAMAALAVDLGILYTARTSAQHAADAAALAGAYALSNASSSDAAKDKAILVASQNTILGRAVTITRSDIQVNEDPDTYQVTVHVPRTGANGIETFFAKVIGFDTVDVQVKATAQAAKFATGSHCLKPLYVANTVLADPGETVTDACNNKHLIFDPDTHQLTARAQAILTACTGPTPSSACVSRLLRPTSPSYAADPSQYYSVDFGSGATTYSCTIGHCLTDPECSDKIDSSVIDNFGNPTVKCGDVLSTQNGNDPNQTERGFADLLGSPPPTFNYIGSYNNGGVTSDSSNAVITAPVWDTCKFPVKPGKQAFPIIGFAKLFVNPADKNGNFSAYLVGGGSCGAQPPGAGAGVGPAGMPVRLIQTPTGE